MPPKLVSDDGRHVVIRPLVYVRERDLARYAELNAFPIIPCNLCGSQEHLQRRQVTAMLRDWEKKHPGRIESIYNALAKVVPSHLMDRTLFDFGAVRATGRTDPDGDIGVRRRSGARARDGRLPQRYPVRPRSRSNACARATCTTEPRHAPHRAQRRDAPRSHDGPLRRPQPDRSRDRRARLRGNAARRRLPSPRPTRRSRHRESAACGCAAARRAAQRRLHPLFPPHVDRLRPERREDDRLRGLRAPAQSHRRGTRRGARDRCGDSRARHSDRRGAREPVLPDAGDRRVDLRPRDAGTGRARRAGAGRRRSLRRAQGAARETGRKRRRSRDREPRQSVTARSSAVPISRRASRRSSIRAAPTAFA